MPEKLEQNNTIWEWGLLIIMGAFVIQAYIKSGGRLDVPFVVLTLVLFSGAFARPTIIRIVF